MSHAGHSRPPFYALECYHMTDPFLLFINDCKCNINVIMVTCYFASALVQLLCAVFCCYVIVVDSRRWWRFLKQWLLDFRTGWTDLCSQRTLKSHELFAVLKQANNKQMMGFTGRLVCVKSGLTCVSPCGFCVVVILFYFFKVGPMLLNWINF